MHKLNPVLLYLLFSASCNQQQARPDYPLTIRIKKHTAENTAARNPENIKVIHVFVALCDNIYQGIVPVPAKIGNGQDPANNLYWGCGYGVKTFFSAQKTWQLISVKKPGPASIILERLVFKYRTKEIYLVADAYNGKEIKQCTINFLKSCCGDFADSVTVNNKLIYCGGASQIIAYTGHDGLMDFSLPETFKATDTHKREAMIFACVSKNYFAKHIANTGATPVVWTTGLCSPEAYSLAAALESRISNEQVENASRRAAAAYSKFQKCSYHAAQKLMVYR